MQLAEKAELTQAGARAGAVLPGAAAAHERGTGHLLEVRMGGWGCWRSVGVGHTE